MFRTLGMPAGCDEKLSNYFSNRLLQKHLGRRKVALVPKEYSVRLFIKPWCGWCHKAVKWLEDRGIKYQTLDVVADPGAAKEMFALSKQTLAPVIEVNGKILADFDVEQLAQFWKQFE